MIAVKKRRIKMFHIPLPEGVAGLFLLSISFVIGSVSGCILVNQVGGDGKAALENFLQEYLTVANSGLLLRPSAAALLWDVLRWPLFLLLLSVTPLGLIGLPVIFLVRGFLLAFSIASFFRIFGAAGLGLAFVLFGISGIFCIPVLFAFGTQGFWVSGALTGRLMGEGRKCRLCNRSTLFRCGVCILILCLCCFLEYHLVPVLMKLYASLVLQ